MENEADAPRTPELPQNAEDEGEAGISDNALEPLKESQFAEAGSDGSDVSMSSV